MLSDWIKTVHKGIFWLKSQLTPRQFLLISAVIVGLSAAWAVVLLKSFAHWVYVFAGDLHQHVHFPFLNVVLPVIGIVLTVFIVKRVLKGNLEKGTWRIVYAIRQRNSLMPRAQMYAQAITSSITVGFGGSAGLESPVTITGAAFGSNYAHKYRLSKKDRTLLLACGVAAAIGAAFNAPIAGVLFTMEVLLADVGITAFIPLMLAAASGSILSTILLNPNILLSFQKIQPIQITNIPFYIVLGILCGFISVYHLRAFHRVEQFLERLKWGSYTKAIVGASVLSGLILVFPPLFGEGMASIKLLSLENPELTLKNTFFESLSSPWMFLIFCGAIIFFKAIATGLTLGSGGNGGNFAPSLFVGSYTGFAFAYGLNLTGWIPSLPVTNFTVAGMAGVLSGLFHAPLTAMFLIAEITGGYELLIPLMIVSSISFALSKYYTPHSMDMLRLASDAPISGTSEKDKQILGSMNRLEVMETTVVVLSPRDTLQTLLDTIQESPQGIFPVVRSDGKLLGMLYLDDLPDYLQLMRSAPHTSLNELMSPIQITVGPDDPLESVMALMDSYNLNYIPVVFHDQVTGYYSKNRILESYRKNLVDSFVE